MRTSCCRWSNAWTMLVLVVLGSGVAGCAGEDRSSDCVMRELADLPVLNDRGSPVVRAAINGTPVAFIVDSGAGLSMIGQTDTDTLALPASFENRHIITGIGGSVFAPDVTIRQLSLGSSVARDVSFVSVGAFKAHYDGLKVVGLFGGDFLANYDVEFDLPAHHVVLYTEGGHCGAHLTPWAGPFDEQPFELSNGTEIDFRMNVNNKAVDAVLDSGATYTVLNLDAANSAGVTAASMATDRSTRSSGVDGNLVTGHLHRFDTLAVGSERFSPVFVNVADIPKTLLGADFLHTHRVWVSYPHETLYIQPVRRIRTIPATGPAGQAPPPVPAARAGEPAPAAR